MILRHDTNCYSGWFAGDAEILNQVGRVLLQLVPIVEPVKPSHIIIPEDCFQLLSIPINRVTTVLVQSVEKLFGVSSSITSLRC